MLERLRTEVRSEKQRELSRGRGARLGQSGTETNLKDVKYGRKVS